MRVSKESSKQLIILTEYFAPSTGATAQLVSDLADDLHSAGVHLTVLTSSPGSAQYSYPVLRFLGPSKNTTGVVQKVLAGLSFFGGTTVWLLKNIKRNHSLLIVSNPPFVGLIGVFLSIFKKTRYAYLFQDVFPRSASLTGILPAQGPLIFLWRFLIKAVLTQSQFTIVLSEAMRRRCSHEYGVKLRLASISNWAVLDPQSKSKMQSRLASEWGICDTLTLQYSGNFGRLHEILIILEAARMLTHHPIKFVFVGGGAKLLQIKRYCDEFNLENVLVKPYQTRHDLSDSLAACDISIVSMIPGAEDTVAPSKFYGIIASSRPVLLISSPDSFLSSLILRAGCGVVVPHGDVCQLAQTILDLNNSSETLVDMGKNARRLYESEYGRRNSTTQYHNLLAQHGMI